MDVVATIMQQDLTTGSLTIKGYTNNLEKHDNLIFEDWNHQSHLQNKAIVAYEHRR